ncbi:hypothetical protein D3C75_503770 [compost metagenome]
MHTGAGNNECRPECGKPVFQLQILPAFLKFTDVRLKPGIRSVHTVDQRNRNHLHIQAGPAGLLGQLSVLGCYENTIEVTGQLAGKEQQQLLCTCDATGIGNVGEEDDCSFVGHGVSALPGKGPRAAIHLLQSFTKHELQSISSCTACTGALCSVVFPCQLPLRFDRIPSATGRTSRSSTQYIGREQMPARHLSPGKCTFSRDRPACGGPLTVDDSQQLMQASGVGMILQCPLEGAQSHVPAFFLVSQVITDFIHHLLGA